MRLQSKRSTTRGWGINWKAAKMNKYSVTANRSRASFASGTGRSSMIIFRLSGDLIWTSAWSWGERQKKELKIIADVKNRRWLRSRRLFTLILLKYFPAKHWKCQWDYAKFEFNWAESFRQTFLGRRVGCVKRIKVKAINLLKPLKLSHSPASKLISFCQLIYRCQNYWLNIQTLPNHLTWASLKAIFKATYKYLLSLIDSTEKLWMFTVQFRLKKLAAEHRNANRLVAVGYKFSLMTLFV